MELGIAEPPRAKFAGEVIMKAYISIHRSLVPKIDGSHLQARRLWPLAH